ncbi:MAG: hypothetical protein IT303_09440 [Dehalococcoidia bacterium]|nr:hypothetical protein [Dehalococcoidia bacterium]
MPFETRANRTIPPLFLAAVVLLAAIAGSGLLRQPGRAGAVAATISASGVDEGATCTDAENALGGRDGEMTCVGTDTFAFFSFPVDLPDGAVVTGFEVDLRVKTSDPRGGDYFSVTFFDQGHERGRRDSGDLGGSLSYVILPSAGPDLWAGTWNAASLASDLRVRIVNTTYSPSDTLTFEYVKLIVHYTVVAPTTGRVLVHKYTWDGAASSWTPNATGAARVHDFRFALDDSATTFADVDAASPASTGVELAAGPHTIAESDPTALGFDFVGLLNGGANATACLGANAPASPSQLNGATASPLAFTIAASDVVHICTYNAPVPPPPLPDLEVTKLTKTPGGVAKDTFAFGEAFEWHFELRNSGGAMAVFPAQQPVFIDELPAGHTYGSPASFLAAGGATATLNCTIDAAKTLVCEAATEVTIPAGGSMTFVLPATATAAGPAGNPRGGGTCRIDPSDVVDESDDGDNGCTHRIVVGDPPPTGTLVIAKVVTNEPGATAQFAGTVHVNGTPLAGGAFTTLTAGDAPLHHIVLPGLLAGAQYSYSVTETPPAGPYATVGYSTGTFDPFTSYATCRGSTSATPVSTTIPVPDTGTGVAVLCIYNERTSSPNLAVAKANDTGGLAFTGETWHWSLALTNAGWAAEFADGAVILRDQLPTTGGATYGTPALSGVTGVTGTVDCAIDAAVLECTAAGAVNIAAGGGFTVTFSGQATEPGFAGDLRNPAAPGGCAADPGDAVTESDELDNGCADTVTSARLRLDAACGGLLTVRNATGESVSFTWDVAGTGASGGPLTAVGSAVPPAEQGTSFSAGGATGLVRIFVGGVLHDSANQDGTACPAPELTAAKSAYADAAGAVPSGPVPAGGSAWWVVTIANGGEAPAVFQPGATVFADDLPGPASQYGAHTASPGLACAVSPGATLTCTASSLLSLAPGDSLRVTLPVTPAAPGTLPNPRPGGTCAVDPADTVPESDEENNGCGGTLDAFALSLAAVCWDAELEARWEVTNPGPAAVTFDFAQLATGATGARTVAGGATLAFTTDRLPGAANTLRIGVGGATHDESDAANVPCTRRVAVHKVVTNNAADATFFTARLGGASGTFSQGQPFDGFDVPVTPGTPAAVVVEEDAHPAFASTGWAVLDGPGATCAGAELDGTGATAELSVEAAYAPLVVCFFNEQLGFVRLVKESDVPIGEQSWAFESDLPALATTLALADPGDGIASASTETFAAKPGDYLVAETLGRWTEETCVAGSLPTDYGTMAYVLLDGAELPYDAGADFVPFAVRPGMTTTIRFANVSCGNVLGAATLFVEKLRDPTAAYAGSEGVAGWPVTVERVGGGYSAFAETDATGVAAFFTLPPGDYIVTEGSGPGWANVGSVADGVAAPGASRQLSVALNEVRTVRFYNQPMVGVHVYKEEEDGNAGPRPGAGWAFTLTGCGVAREGVTGADGRLAFADLPPADGCAYTVTEAAVPGWDAVPSGVQTAAPRIAGEVAELRFRNVRAAAPPPVATPGAPALPVASPTPPGSTAPPTPTASPSPAPAGSVVAPVTVTRTATAAPPASSTPTPPPAVGAAPPAGTVVEAIAGTRTVGPSVVPGPPATGNGTRGGGAPVALLALAGLVSLLGGATVMYVSRQA